jgi:1-Cys peroxiredoxin 6
MRLGATVPDFRAETTGGSLNWHEYIEGHWSVLFSHPADFTPVCTTELGSVASLQSEFDKRGVKIAALSCNDTESHKAWVKDIEHLMFHDGKEGSVSYPIISDPKREIAVLYGMLDPEEKDAQGLPMTCRAVFVIKPDKTLALSILYPATTGRNFNEVLRTIDSLQLTAQHSVATPADWSSGKDCMVVPSLSDEEARAKFEKGFATIHVPSGKEYLRTTQDPSK